MALTLAGKVSIITGKSDFSNLNKEFLYPNNLIF
jgi:hypothetical protein